MNYHLCNNNVFTYLECIEKKGTKKSFRAFKYTVFMKGDFLIRQYFCFNKMGIFPLALVLVTKTIVGKVFLRHSTYETDHPPKHCGLKKLMKTIEMKLMGWS